MTVVSNLKVMLGKLLREVRESAKKNEGKMDGPLGYITKPLGLDFLDDEWKRALFFGFFIAVISFFIALFGNLTNDEDEPAEDEDDKNETKVDPKTEVVVKLKGRTIDDALRTIDEEQGAEVTAEPGEIYRDESATDELAQNTLAGPQPIVDGGSSAFQSMLNRMRPKWWTREMESNISVVSNLYMRLLDDWLKSHQFRTPLSLNVLLGGLFSREYAHDITELGEIGNKDLARAHYFLQFADATYAENLLSAGILRRSVIKACLGVRTEDEKVLRYVLFVDHLTQSVVLMIRGTVDFEDMLVDLLAEEVEFMDGVAHAGLLAQARTIVKEIGSLIEETLVAHKYKTLVFTGHSLGAGAAVLASLIIREEHPALDKVTFQCYVYGCPPTVGPPEKFPPDHPVISKVEIVSFVNNSDVIPRTSMFGLEAGIRLWIALDSIEDFSISDRIRCIFNGKLPDNVTKRVSELMDNTESKSMYQKMITPGRCIWLVRHKGSNYRVSLTEKTENDPQDSANSKLNGNDDESEVFISCPADPLTISSQPMFVGYTWLFDHRLMDYRLSLESV